jgi:hypothetical protein
VSQKLVNSIYSRLTTDQTSGSLYDDVGGRIYYGKAPDDSALPAIIIDLVNEKTTNAMAGGYGDRVDTASFQIDIYGDIKIGVVSVGNIEIKLFNLLDSVTLSATDYNHVSVECTTRNQRTMGDEAHRIVSEYDVIGSASS